MPKTIKIFVHSPLSIMKSFHEKKKKKNAVDADISGSKNAYLEVAKKD